MADAIKIPGIGPVEKKWVYVGGALIAGIVGYAYWARSSASNAEVDEEEPVYETETPVDDYVPPGSSTGTVDVDNNPSPTTNAEWTWQVFDKLTENGYKAGKVSTALAKYFARARLSPNQGAIIRAGHAFFGPPPVGDYPINIHKDEPEKPDEPDELPKLIAPTGLSAHDIGSTTVGLLWNAVSGARYYQVSIPGKSTELNTASTHLSVTGLKRNTLYRVRVRAHGMDKRPGPYSESRQFRTKK